MWRGIYSWGGLMTQTKFPWDKMDNEPSIWYERFFTFYRPLGRERTLTGAYRDYYYESHNEYPTRPGYSADWGKKAQEWQWKDRAEAWDLEITNEQIARERVESAKMYKRQLAEAEAVGVLAMGFVLKAKSSDELNTASRTLEEPTAWLSLL
jgi:hypothetical protein